MPKVKIDGKHVSIDITERKLWKSFNWYYNRRRAFAGYYGESATFRLLTIPINSFLVNKEG